MRVPITNEFDDSLKSLLGYAELHPEALETIQMFIEKGVIPHFAISFTGEPDENGVYHKAELVSISMITGRPPVEKVSDLRR